ncbi:MAG: ATP-binding protein [Pseudomonadota bacterium]
MVNSDLNILQGELSGRLQKLMFLRVLFVSLLLGASAFIQVRQSKTYFGDIQTSHYVLIAAVYFLTFFYIIFLKKQKNLLRLTYTQLMIDTFFVTAMVYTTGGIESIFSFLYILTIINGSIILYRRGGMVMASSSSILYGLLLDLHYYNIIQPFGSRLNYPEEYHSFYIFYIIVVNIAAFYLIAFLSSYPSEQARKSRVELKAKQHDIVKLEALNEWIIRSIASGLITLDDQDRILLFNPAAETIFGIGTDEVIGKKILDAIPFLEEYLKPDPAGQKSDIWNTIVDLPYQRGDGQRLFLQFSVSPLSLPDRDQKGRILIFQDMTKMRQIEEEMKKVEGLAMIGELAAGIAHEIRNPMASISGSIQMLKESIEQDAVGERLMGIILREINRLNHLVDDFLLFARPKHAEVKKFRLNDLIRDSIALFKNSGKWVEKIRLSLDFGQSIDMESDPEQIRQILWNLFLNAREAMPEGGLLQVRAEMLSDPDRRQEAGRMIKIAIRDTGEGFSQQALRHLFSPFFTTKDGGTGLGLAIVKRIVEGLGGEIEGKNHPEGGAEITILLNAELSRTA